MHLHPTDRRHGRRQFRKGRGRSSHFTRRRAIRPKDARPSRAWIMHFHFKIMGSFNSGVSECKICLTLNSK
jgi:hypothetical protein